MGGRAQHRCGFGIISLKGVFVDDGEMKEGLGQLVGFLRVLRDLLDGSLYFVGWFVRIVNNNHYSIMVVDSII